MKTMFQSKCTTTDATVLSSTPETLKFINEICDGAGIRLSLHPNTTVYSKCNGRPMVWSLIPETLEIILARQVLRGLDGWALRRDVALSHASVDDKVGSVDEAALIAGKEKHSLCEFDSLAKASSGEVDLAAVALRLVISEPVLEKRGAAKISLGSINGQREGLTSTVLGRES